jgi:rubrerythrin
MEIEQNKILEALKIAIELEKDDKECYLQASQDSGNDVGRKIFGSLAHDEDLHRKKFEEIFNDIQQNKGWPLIDPMSDNSQKLRELFNETCAAAGVNVKAAGMELDAISTAIQKEKTSYDFYKRQSQNATFDTERTFYEAVAAEEMQHELVLTDYLEYLTDPVDWFTRVEHHSLDG